MKVDTTIREPDQIRQDCVHKLRAAKVSDDFQAIILLPHRSERDHCLLDCVSTLQRHPGNYSPVSKVDAFKVLGVE